MNFNGCSCSFNLFNEPSFYLFLYNASIPFKKIWRGCKSTYHCASPTFTSFVVVWKGRCIIFPGKFRCIAAIWVSGNEGGDVSLRKSCCLSVFDGGEIPMNSRD